ncbi:hypothetical protein D3C73_953740 [compost metagenome]
MVGEGRGQRRGRSAVCDTQRSGQLPGTGGAFIARELYRQSTPKYWGPSLACISVFQLLGASKWSCPRRRARHPSQDGDYGADHSAGDDAGGASRQRRQETVADQSPTNAVRQMAQLRAAMSKIEGDRVLT